MEDTECMSDTKCMSESEIDANADALCFLPLPEL
jgi:hypothetical protein